MFSILSLKAILETQFGVFFVGSVTWTSTEYENIWLVELLKTISFNELLFHISLEADLHSRWLSDLMYYVFVTEQDILSILAFLSSFAFFALSHAWLNSGNSKSLLIYINCLKAKFELTHLPSAAIRRAGVGIKTWRPNLLTLIGMQLTKSNFQQSENIGTSCVIVESSSSRK